MATGLISAGQARAGTDPTGLIQCDNIGAAGGGGACIPDAQTPDPFFRWLRDASDATKAANQAVREYLPFEDQTDFENAGRGFIATLESGRITGEGGATVYDMKQYEFLEKGDPTTVNPSLWRQSRLNAMDGLFKVIDGKSA